MTFIDIIITYASRHYAAIIDGAIRLRAMLPPCHYAIIFDSAIIVNIFFSLRELPLRYDYYYFRCQR